VKRYAGRFPRTADELRALPGIGPYTAAAIASIAFDEPIAVVDGNVERVIERLVGERLPKKELWQTAQELLSPRRPGDFNQAMMELGATVCLPREPMCLACPVSGMCATRGELSRAGKKTRQKKQIHFALGTGLAGVFKVSCPAWHYEFPFRERIYKTYGNKNVTIVGVSQNEKKETVSFIKEHGVTFPVLLDETRTFPASNAYALTNVP